MRRRPKEKTCKLFILCWWSNELVKSLFTIKVIPLLQQQIVQCKYFQGMFANTSVLLLLRTSEIKLQWKTEPRKNSEGQFHISSRYTQHPSPPPLSLPYGIRSWLMVYLRNKSAACDKRHKRRLKSERKFGLRP